MITPPLTPASPPTPKKQHLTRLLSIWRSDGWPSKDALEIELLVAGWVCLVNEAGHDRLRLTESGLAHLAASRQRNQRALSTHDRLAHRVAGQLHGAGRVVWKSCRCGPGRGPPPCPDTTTENTPTFSIGAWNAAVLRSFSFNSGNPVTYRGLIRNTQILIPSS